MTNARGDQAQLFMRQQAAFGVASAVADSTYFKMPFYSLNMTPSQEQNEDDAIYGDAFPGDSVAGIVGLTGSLEVPLGLSSIGLQLLGMLGTPDTTLLSAGKYEHVFTAKAAPVLPLFTTGVSHGGVGVDFQQDSIAYTGIDFSAKKEGQRSRLNINLVGRDETQPGATVDATPVEFALDPVPVGFTAKVKKDGVEVAGVTEMNFNLTNGVEMDQETINGLATAAATMPGRWGLNGGLNARFRDTTWLDLGASGQLVDLSISYTFDADHSLEFLLHNMRIERTGVPISGREVLSSSFNFQASRPASGSFPFTATLTNKVADYANPV